GRSCPDLAAFWGRLSTVAARSRGKGASVPLRFRGSRHGRGRARRGGAAPRVGGARDAPHGRGGSPARLPPPVRRGGTGGDSSPHTSNREGGEMKSRWILALLVALVAVAAYVGNVLATSSVGQSTTILAKATVDDLDLSANYTTTAIGRDGKPH